MDQAARRFEVAVNGCRGRQRLDRRHAATLVKLALAPVTCTAKKSDAVWLDDDIDAAVPKLHKAAHFACRATLRRHDRARNDTERLADSAVEIDAGIETGTCRARRWDTPAPDERWRVRRGNFSPDPYEGGTAPRATPPLHSSLRSRRTLAGPGGPRYGR